ncbi:hypothetical protein LTR47_009949 [Exophiala xenobiotica]|nr:hypothetical protein LTR72_011207 [Exophiala xenobiotica]KAK5224192.1 hypothetical protein LTR47_009949 [Exophiala xenobiotica]KAK5250306.1 hypothetical protein LTS06_004884 [Exophiala xenobiotica]KAK5284270.1 hypothetical protein LTR40_000548 [Exophiala xenobiotica]KAK5285421.1 hypothetical protein LTR14_010957 [Exophiala xenobiotica]
MSLTIVYPPHGSTSSPAVDIVAVHGLGGNAVNTWTHPKSKKCWLRDFLPQQIPDARIMTFGYNADVAFGQSTAEIIDHAKSLLVSLVDKREEPEEIQRPLIFVAHSLGGIVVKQALFQARLESRYQSMKDATLGLIFMGTPHQGSDKAIYGEVLANVAQFISHRPPQRLLTALQTNSEVLLRLTTDFRFQLPDYEVYSFFELRPMKGLSSLIVEKHSALLETNHEEQIPVDADHSAMCKFETENDDTFEKVYKRMKRMRPNLQRVTNEQAVLFNQRFESPCLLRGNRDDVMITSHSNERGGTVDVRSRLEAKSAKTSRTLRWRKSVVDLLELLGVDSEFETRKQLAFELGVVSRSYAGTDSQNVALRAAIINDVEENQGSKLRKARSSAGLCASSQKNSAGPARLGGSTQPFAFGREISDIRGDVDLLVEYTDNTLTSRGWWIRVETTTSKTTNMNQEQEL